MSQTVRIVLVVAIIVLLLVAVVLGIVFGVIYGIIGNEIYIPQPAFYSVIYQSGDTSSRKDVSRKGEYFIPAAQNEVQYMAISERVIWISDVPLPEYENSEDSMYYEDQRVRKIDLRGYHVDYDEQGGKIRDYPFDDINASQFTVINNNFQDYVEVWNLEKPGYTFTGWTMIFPEEEDYTILLTANFVKQ